MSDAQEITLTERVPSEALAVDGWRLASLEQFIKIKHGYAFSGEFITSEPTPNVLVTPGNFHIGGGFKASKFKYYAGDVPETYKLKAGDIVVTMTDLSKDGDTLGYGAKIPASAEKTFLHNQRIGLVQFNGNADRLVDTDFLYWVLRTREYQAYVLGAATGTSVRHTSPSTIHRYEFALPDRLDEQRSVAAVLGRLDEKIDLLLRQNQTLEAMAEALFRQWFVEEMDGHWETCTVGDMFSIRGGTTPSTKEASYWDGEIAWTSPRDLANATGLYLFATGRKITSQGLAQIGSGLLPRGTVLLSSRAPIGYLAITDIPVAINQGYIAMVCDDGIPNHFAYLWCKHHMEEIKAAGNGSTFEEISKSNFKALPFKVPPVEKLAAFDEVATPIFSKLRSNELQTRQLGALRDALLPKLMSGEVRVAC